MNYIERHKPAFCVEEYAIKIPLAFLLSDNVVFQTFLTEQSD